MKKQLAPANHDADDAAVWQLRAIFEGSADAIYCWQIDGTIRLWNPAAERLYGYTRTEIVGKSIELLIPSDRADEWATIVRRLKQGESIEQLETERLRKNGERVSVAITVSPVRDNCGQVVSASVIVRDVTERKRREVELRECERRFRQMADNAPVMIWMSGHDKACTWFNKPWLDFVGRSMERELGTGWTEGVHVDDYDRCMATYESNFDSRTPFRMEYRLRRADGEYRWLLDAGVPLCAASGEFIGYIGSCVDITDRKQTEQALVDREVTLRAVLNTAADAIVTIDRRGVIRSVNPATERMLGYSCAEMVGQNISMLMPPPYRESHDGYLARYLKTGQRHIIDVGREVQARRKDGSIFAVDLAVSEIEELGLFTGILRDITRRKELEHEVVEIASLEQRRIGRDLHDSVAQELAAVNLLTRDLAETLEADSTKARKLVEQIAQGLQRTQKELRAVLHGLMPVPVDTEGLTAALDDLADRTKKEKLTCVFDCTKAISVLDHIVATHLYLIAQEAVRNAIRHAQAGTVRIALAENGGLTLSVEDDGIGMAARPGSAEGLGMRIMRNRAAIIGATLSIERGTPRGTTVTCKLESVSHEREDSRKASSDSNCR